MACGRDLLKPYDDIHDDPHQVIKVVYFDGCIFSIIVLIYTCLLCTCL